MQTNSVLFKHMNEELNGTLETGLCVW